MPTSLIAPLVVFAALIAPPSIDDKDTLQGEWSGTVNLGQEIPVVFKFMGDKVDIILTSPDGDQLTLDGKLKLNESASPKQIDFVDFVGPDGNDLQDNPSIYRLEGDELTICAGGPGNPRPTEFKAEQGGPTLIVLKKVKKVD